MVLVVVAGLIYGSGVLRERRVRFTERADMHARQGSAFRARADDLDDFATRVEQNEQEWSADLVSRIPAYRMKANEARGKAAQHDAKRLKYERAARYPWIPIAPIPSGPE